MRKTYRICVFAKFHEFLIMFTLAEILIPLTSTQSLCWEALIALTV